MIKEIEKSRIAGTLPAISSKSYAHRMMLCALLTEHDVTLLGVTRSMDIEATLNVARAFGGRVEELDGGFRFSGNKSFPKRTTADCIESGSTLRFSIPLAAALGIETEFKGSERLLSRPNDALFECLEKHGATVDGYRIGGKLQPGRYEIDASISSQYITGLLTALPLLSGDSELILKGTPVSKAYIDITTDVLRSAGIMIDNTRDGFIIYGNQRYDMPEISYAHGDWSNAAFFLVAGALSGNSATVSGLQRDGQGDARILDFVKKYGAEVTVNGDKVTVNAKNAQPIDVDIEDTPDLAPILSVLCASCKGKSVLRNVDRLRIKESDRLNAIIENLARGGVRAEYDDNKLVIYGTGEIARGVYEGYNDHRMVMSAAVMSSVSGGVINGAEAVRKSYPEFFEDFSKIGGKVK